MARLPLVDEIAAVLRLCRKLGFDDVAPTLLKAAHRTTLLIPAPHAMVAKVQSSGDLAKARRISAREISVARHLSDRGAPAIGPLEDTPGPYDQPSMIITLWPHIAHERTADEADATLAATTLAMIHQALRDYPGDLPSHMQALDHCWHMIEDDAALHALSSADRDLLRAQFRRLRHEIEAIPAQQVPLHGDVHLGNLLLSARGPIWTDFEDACLGPREMDIAGLPPAAWPLFEDADQGLIGRYADLKSVCVATWCWADISRSAEVREAAEYHLQRVRDFAW